MAETVQFKFRRRYNLPPNDPRFLDATIEEMVVDLWAHAHTEHPQLRDADETEGFEESLAAMEAGGDLEEMINASYGGKE